MYRYNYRVLTEEFEVCQVCHACGCVVETVEYTPATYLVGIIILFISKKIIKKQSCNRYLSV